MGVGPQAIIFDFDGTLIDASEAICHSFNQVLSKNGLPKWDEASIRRMIGRPLRDMFTTAVPTASPEDVERFVSEYRATFFPVSTTLARPLPGCAETVATLASTSKLAIATSRAGNGAWRILEAMKLHIFFETIIGIYDVERPKPHPEPVLRALQRMCVKPAYAALVGDTTDDMVAGKAAGVFTIGITTGVHDLTELTAAGADVVIESLRQLPELLVGPGSTGSSSGGL